MDNDRDMFRMHNMPKTPEQWDDQLDALRKSSVEPTDVTIKLGAGSAASLMGIMAAVGSNLAMRLDALAGKPGGQEFRLDQMSLEAVALAFGSLSEIISNFNRSSIIENFHGDPNVRRELLDMNNLSRLVAQDFVRQAQKLSGE